MSDSSVENARHPEQIARMEKLKAEGQCFFCDKNYLSVGASPAIYEGEFWYVKKNDYPYEGSVHHYLIVPKAHVMQIGQLQGSEWDELRSMISWVEDCMDVPGASLLVRSGDTRFTGATFQHLHFQFVSGGPKPADLTRENAAEKCLPITLGYRKA